MTDSELKRFVESALQREVRLRGRDISVAVEDGQVMLRGVLPELAEKRLAMNLVRQLREVGQVRDQLRLVTAKELTDKQIQNHILDAWQQDPTIHEDRLRVRAQDGVAILEGTLDSLEEKRLAGLCAWWVPGVADVDNRIKVEPDQPGNQGDLVDSIRQALDKDVLVDPSLIGVMVQGTTVTLTGTVYSEEAKQAAEHDAYFIWGVDQVINQLRVSPR